VEALHAASNVRTIMRHSASASSLSCFNKSLEKPTHAAMLLDHHLGMPLHAEAKGVIRSLEAFDDAVGGAGRDDEAISHPVGGLVVRTIDADVARSDEGGQSRPGRHGYSMSDCGGRTVCRGGMREQVGDLARNILDQCAPCRHIEHLNPTTNS
jgi:hypothetical protein